MFSASSGLAGGSNGCAPGVVARRGPRTARALATSVVVFLGACFLDQLTSSGPDLSDIDITVTGDTLVVLGGAEPLDVVVTGTTSQGPSHIEWSTSNPALATVDSTGIVTGAGIGTVSVTARLTAPEIDTGLVVTHLMRVQYASIAIDPVDSLEGLGETVTLVAQGQNLAGASIAPVGATFSVAANQAVAVTPAGLATARFNGTATVTATFDGMTDQEDVQVRQVAKSVQFSINNIVFPALNRDTTAVLVVKDVRDSSIQSPAVVWSSNDGAIVSVTTAGVMRALQVAPTTITARVDTAQGQLNTSVVQVPVTIVAGVGNNQTDTVNQALPVVPCVRVDDAGGTGVQSLTVTFTVTSGGGALTGGSQLTNASGVACVASWTLGTAAGSNTLQAAAGTLTPATITATGVAGPATQIAKLSADSQSATAGQAVAAPPSIRLQDAFGNPVAGKAVVFAVQSGGGSVSIANQTTDANGVATVGSWTVGTLTSTNTLTATAGALVVTFTAFSTSGTPTLMSLSSGGSQSGPVGTTVPVPPSVRVSDNFGNGVPGVVVTFAGTAGNGTIAGATPATNANGIATVTSWTLDTIVGSDTIIASATGLTPVSFVATSSAGAAATMDADAGDLQTDTVGSTVTVPPSVRVADQYNNLKPGVTVTFTVLTGGGTVTGATKVTNASGIATVTSWTLGTTAGTNNNTLRASAGTLAYTLTATARPGPAASVVKVSGDAQVGAPGGTLASPYIVKVVDQYNNGVSLVTINWGAGSGGTITTPAVTDAGGFAQALHTLGSTPGTQVATATPAIALAGSPIIFTATANSAPTQVILFAGNNQSGAVNTTVATPPSVKVTDQAGNPSANVTVTFAVATGGGSLTQGTQSTNASGVATVGSWTLGQVAGTDNNTLTATAPGLTGSPITFTASATAGAAATLALDAGNNQTATVNTNVAIAPAVKVTDQFNNPVAGASVTFAPATGSGSVGGGNAFTNGAGVATVGSWTLGMVAGANKDTLFATSGSLAGSPVSFVASATPGAAFQIAANSAVNQSDTVALPVATLPSVLVTDAFSNAVANVPVTFSIVSGSGSVTGASQATNANGLATVGSWTLGIATGTNNNSMIASSGTLANSPVIFTASATNGVATQIASNGGTGQTATVNTAVATAPSVIVKDQFGNAVSGFAVTFAPAPGSGTVTGGTPASNASGIATVGSWTLGTTAGANRDTLRATATGLTGSPVVFTATGTAGAAAQIAKAAGDNQSAVAGSAVPVPPQVLATDQFGNPVAGVLIGFGVTGGGGSTTGDTAVSNASGLATVDSWTLGGSPGPNTLSATSIPALTGSPLTFTATGGAAGPTTMALDGGNNQSGTVNTSLSTAYSVLVTDATSAPVQGVTVSWAVTSGGGSMSVPSSLTDVNGIATATRTLGTSAGPQTATASVGGLTGSPVTFTATANPGAPFQISVNAGFGQGDTVNTAVPVPPRVQVADQFGNGVAGVTVTFAVASGGGSITAPTAPVTDANGLAAVGSWILGTVAGANSLTATAPGLNGSPLTFPATGFADVASQVVLNDGDGQFATVGTAVATPPSAKVTDQFGNPKIGFGVSFAVASGGGNVSGAGVSTDANGVARVGSWTLGAAAGPNTLTATATGLAGSPVTFTATGGGGPPAPNTSIVLVGAGTVPSATSTTLTLNSKDAFGNPAQSGHAVVFNYSGGTSTGTIGPVTDQANGSYTASFTGLGAGSAQSVGATIDGITVTSALPTVTVIPGAPAVILVSQGDNQSAEVNTSVGIAPSVLVTDVNSNGVAGVSVTFGVASGGGSLVGPVQSTNASGIATVGKWTLGTSTSVLQSLSATSGTLSGSPLTFLATATPGPFSYNTSITTVANDSVGAGSAVPITLQAKDAFGNNLTSGGLPGVTFILTGGTSDGSQCCNTDVGNGTYTASYTGTVAGSPDTIYTMVNAGTVQTPPPLIRVIAGPVASIGFFDGNGQAAMVGTAVSVTPAAILHDGFGNPVPNSEVEFYTPDGGQIRVPGTTCAPFTSICQPGPISVFTGPDGVARMDWIMNTTPGGNSLTAVPLNYIFGPPPQLFFSATATAPSFLGNVYLGNLHLGEAPVGVAVSNNLNRVFVATRGGLTTPPGITVIDGGPDSATNFMPVPAPLTDVAISHLQGWYYVTTDNAQVQAYDILNSFFQTASNLSCGPSPAVAVAEQQSRVYVVSPSCNQIEAFDLNLASINGNGTNGKPVDVAADNQGQVYVAAGAGYVDVYCGGSGSGCGFSNLNYVHSVFIGGSPRSVAVDTNTRMVFATNGGQLIRINGNCVFCNIDGIIALPFAGTGVEVNAAFGLVYVTDSVSGQVAVYDEFFNFQNLINAGTGAVAAAANTNTGAVYTANRDAGTVTVINVVSFQNTVARAGGSRAVAVNPATGRIAVANEWTRNVIMVDGFAGRVVGAVPGGALGGVAINPNTNYLFIVQADSNRVDVRDATTGELLTTIFVGFQPRNVAVNPATNLVYVTNYGSSSVTVINGLSLSVVTNIPVAFSPNAVTVDPVRNLVYVTADNSGGSPGAVQTIDGNTNGVIAALPGFLGPSTVGVETGSGQVYFNDAGFNFLFYAQGPLLSPSSGFGTPETVTALAVHPASHGVFLPGSGGVYVVSTDLNALVHTLPITTSGSFGIAVDPVLRRVYVSDYSNARLHIIQN